MDNKKREAKAERLKQKQDAGLMSTHFPQVERVVISMLYKQRGLRNPLIRTVNFFPDSYAFFNLNCLSNDCQDGGFNLTQIITTMVESRAESSKGELSCSTSSDHPSITYDVAIQYI